MTRFRDRVAVVTGATSGIGRASALALAEEGAHVLLAGRDAEAGRAVEEEMEGTAEGGTFVPTDVRDDDQVAALASQAAERGGIDFWFNNAGYDGPIAPLVELDDKTVRDLLETNVKGVFSGLRHAAGRMGEGGVIVNNASFVGTRIPVPVAVAYGGTKAAVVSMTRSAAIDLQDEGIAVYGVAPYIVDTPMVDRLTGGQGPEARAAFAAQFAPSGKLTRPEEVAEVVLDLFAGSADVAPGDVLLVDAGPTVEKL